MARKYTRDSRGRFSGGGGGGSRPKATGGSLKARGSAKQSAAKLAAKDKGDSSLSGTLSRRAQKAAVTRTGKASKAAQAANRTKMAGGRPAGVIGKRGGKVAEPAAQVAKPASKLGFNQSDFLRRSQRTASIANPQVRQRAQQLYGKILILDSSPKQLKTMFRKLGKPKRQTSPRRSASRREHEDMLRLAPRLFR